MEEEVRKGLSQEVSFSPNDTGWDGKREVEAEQARQKAECALQLQL